jgi:ectoine hydroxylase-related dioxygenase (phytanoyl-CoA dioxygenase family)
VEAITQAQRFFFEANGFLVIEDALTAEELAAARRACDAAEARWRAEPERPGVRRWDLEQVAGIMEYDPFFVEMVEHPRILPLVRALLGPDLRLLDHDYFITPPGTTIHRGWHYDESFPGVYHPRSTLMIKVFYVLDDIAENGGGTVILPGSHAFPYQPPNSDVPEDLPGAVRIALPAGAAYLMSGRAWHSAGNNLSDRPRRLLIYTFGHKWMRMWDGYQPSERVLALAETPMCRQLFGLTDPYGPNAPYPAEGATP